MNYQRSIGAMAARGSPKAKGKSLLMRTQRSDANRIAVEGSSPLSIVKYFC